MESTNKLVAVLGDPHFSARNFNSAIANNQLEFFQKVFFPTVFQKGIKKVLCLGDLFDSTTLSTKALYFWKKNFFDILLENDIEFITLIGNHTVTSRLSNKVNVERSVLNEYPNVSIISEPENIFIYDKEFCVIPWIHRKNVEDCAKIMEESEASICVGHFELGGFNFSKTQMNNKTSEIEKYNLLAKFDQVLSGHFHTPSQKGNINYVGTPYQMSWSDYGDIKGFYILDCHDGSMEYIVNPYDLYHVIKYDANEPLPDISELGSKFVQLHIMNEGDSTELKSLVSNILVLEPADLKIIDKNILAIKEDVKTEEVNINDTRNLLISYLKTTSYDKIDKLQDVLTSTYDEALDLVWKGGLHD